MKTLSLAMRAAALAALIGLGACASRPAATPAPVETRAPATGEAVRQPEVLTAPQTTPPAPAPSTTASSQPTAPMGPAPGTIADFQANAGDRVFFETDRFDLSAEAAWLQAYPGVQIMVAGNCDERGTREYNLALGSRRANAVRDYLVGLGVNPSRISTVSYGKERPIDPRSNPEGWAVNRNGHTQLVGGAALS
jgi:peptidoglycan-associated lipoprotein